MGPVGDFLDDIYIYSYFYLCVYIRTYYLYLIISVPANQLGFCRKQPVLVIFFQRLTKSSSCFLLGGMVVFVSCLIKLTVE